MNNFFVPCARVILSSIEPLSNDNVTCQSCQSRRVRRGSDSAPVGARSAHLVSESLRIDKGVPEEQQVCLAWLVRPWEGLVFRADERDKMKGVLGGSMAGCYYMCMVLGTGIAKSYCGGICDGAVPTRCGVMGHRMALRRDAHTSAEGQYGLIVVSGHELG